MLADPSVVALAVAALLLAAANGANDNAKGVATLYGSGLLGFRPAMAWAGLTTLAGSLAAVSFSGGLLQRFTGKGLVADGVARDPAFLLAAAVGAATTVGLATRLGLPVSTTHGLTGGLVGAGLVLGGVGGVRYAPLASGFVLPLLLSPLVALGLAATAAAAARALRRAGWGNEACVCVACAPVTPLIQLDGAALRVASSPALVVGQTERCRRAGARPLVRVKWDAVRDGVHVFSAGAVGFARGLNDTPKLAAMVVAIPALTGHAGTGLVAIAMAVGGLLAARRVARTLAFRITPIGRDDGVGANLVTAALVALASPLGLPVSTTHVSCGALFGLGASSGRARRDTIVQIVGAWAFTLPLAAIVAAAAAFAARLARLL